MNEMTEKITQAAIEAAYEGGRSTLGYFRTQRYRIESKPDKSPVTEADKTAEKIIVGYIKKHFPGHAVLGEEFGEIEGREPWRWIIDPIDGTKSFIHNIPLFGTTIGVENRETGEIVTGVCYYPAMDEMLYAGKNGGTFLNGRRVSVSETGKLELALLLLTDFSDLSKTGLRDLFDKLLPKVSFTRTWGDCFGHKLVACGQADIMIDPWMKIWDIAPLIPIIQEAGGSIFSWDGKPVLYGEGILSCNGVLTGILHEMLKL